MSAEMLSPAGAPRQDSLRRSGLGMRPVVGVLADGTAFYAPAGEVVVEGSQVTCHLCGRCFRSVAAHLPAHGWTKQQYCEAFGLERSQSLEGPETRKLRSAAFSARLLFEPAVRQGSAAGRQRARAGDLARDAAAAARGRPFPQQRRRKAALARAAMPAEFVTQASRDRADRQIIAAAAEVAQRHGHPDIGSFVLARVRDGASLAAISRAAGLHKDWLSRHLGRLDPAAADAVRRCEALRADISWRPALTRLGYPDVGTYLRERHLGQHYTVNAIAVEAGVSHHAVAAALRRHAIAPVAHARKRNDARERAADVAAQFGYPDIATYIDDRRSASWTWRAIAAESGQPQTWLRRQHRPDQLAGPRSARAS
jgi:ROS/MUCR transcriptional regulator protein